MSLYNPPPDSVYRPAGQDGGINYNVQGGQKTSLHSAVEGDAFDSIIYIPQVIDLNPSYFMVQRQAINNGTPDFDVEMKEINATLRDVPQSYTIKTCLPTPSGGQYRVRLANYVCHLPTPTLMIYSDGGNNVPFALDGRLQTPGFITTSFPGASLPFTRVVTSVPCLTTTDRFDSATVTPAGNVDTKRQPINQSPVQTDRLLIPTGEAPAVGYNLPLSHDVANEGIRNAINTKAITGTLSKFGTLTSTSDGKTDVDQTVTNDGGTDTGVLVDYQIHLPVYCMQNYGFEGGDNRYLYDSVRQGKVYLFWELTPMTKVSSS